MKRQYVAAGLVAAALILTGCGQAAETAVEAGTGMDVEIGDGGGTVTLEQDGTKISAGVNAELPAGWPEELPTPPNGQLISSSGSAEQVITSWVVEGLTADGITEYLNQVKAAGYTQEISTADFGSDAEMISKTTVLGGKGKEVSVAVTIMDGSGLINVQVATPGTAPAQ